MYHLLYIRKTLTSAGNVNTVHRFLSSILAYTMMYQTMFMVNMQENELNTF